MRLSVLPAPSVLSQCIPAHRWASLTAAAKKVYELRYKLMTYMYGSMFLAHRKGGTLARPVFFTDPSDLAARCVNTCGVVCLCSWQDGCMLFAR